MARAPGDTRTTLRPRHALPSVLPAALPRLLAATLAPALFVVANALYLLIERAGRRAGLWNVLAGGATTLPKLFQAMALSHTGVGLVPAALVLNFVIAHLPRVWQGRHTDSVV